MRSMRFLPYCVISGALLCSTALPGASTLAAQEVAPTIRIVNRIDESQRVTLKGNTYPAANAKNDVGRVSPDLPMTDLILVLSRSPQQQAAFEKFIAGQYDESSPDFHHWLQPDEVGQKFGPAENDIAAISAWLTGHGFSVDQVANDHMSIRFSGTAAQVESAFHTEIHNLSVRGVAHIGNMSDPQIPAALAPVVVGVKSLHNFFPHPLHTLGSQVGKDATTGKWKRVAAAPSTATKTLATGKSSGIRPQFGISVPAGGGFSAYLVEDVSPYDFATIYNILPLWNAGTDGTGQTIAIAATSSIVPGDVTSFRSTFGLPAYTGTQLALVSGNSQPPTVCTDTTGTLPYSSNPCGISDLVENSLDAEWSGAVAKGANIVVVSSYPASATDDTLYDSESYIINHTPLVAHIMNVSYGVCELGNGTAGNVEYYNLWQTAASEGIAVFVASGDSGAASCDQGGDAGGTPYAAEFGTTVSGVASTPYNTAVGGTDFNWCSLTSTAECTPAPYWNSTNASNGSSAKGYVPEVPWNDTCANPLAATFLETDWANPLGISGVTSPELACNFVIYYYQSIYYYYGVDLSPFVDTVGGGGGASGCIASTSTSTTDTCTAGATSTGATIDPDTGAAQASLTLVNNGWPKPSWQTGVPGIPADGVRDIPDVSFFASDGFLSSSAYLICVSDITSCTYSTTVEPTELEVGGTSVASPTMAGVMALINQKTGSTSGSPGVNAELYKLAAKQTYSGCSAETVTAASTSCYFNDIDTGNNATPCDDGAGGFISPNCTVLYSADQGGLGILSGYSAGTGYDLATGLGSLNIANVVNAWTATAGSAASTVTVAPAKNSITADQSLNVTVTVASSPAGGATPTGSVTLSGGGYTSATATLASGSYTFTIPGSSLSAGSVTLTAAYSGDGTYAPASGTATVTVTKLTPTVSVTPSQTTFNSNQQITVTGTVTGTSVTPTGTVTLSGDGYTSAPATLSSGSYSITIPYNSFTQSATFALTALYSGDTVYNSATGSANVTVTYVKPLTPTVTVTPASTTLNSGQSLKVTATVSGSGATPTGTVLLSGGGYASTAQTLVAGTYAFTIPANTLNIGTDTLTVAFTTGDANYASGLGNTSVTVALSTFTLSASAATPSSVAPGGSAGSTITVNTSNNYSGMVALSCTAATSNPSNTGTAIPTCTSTNGSAVAAGGTATFTVSTSAPTTSGVAYPMLPGKGKGWAGAGGGAVLALLVFLGIPARRRSWRSMLGIIILMTALGGLSACGGGGGTTTTTVPGTAAGTYSFTITGTGTPADTPAPTATFSVVVN
ncbi:MAG: protease pro-enzyme activation domain-containing protein [Terracidiphilus sp.]